jgi:hypothetical protein
MFRRLLPVRIYFPTFKPIYYNYFHKRNAFLMLIVCQLGIKTHRE